MARARSPDSIEAEKLYKEGMLLVDIAKKLGKPEGTVRRWKSTQNWDGESKGKKGERSGKKKANARKSPGGQKGNKNAVGHGGIGPPGNKNALKHGGYSQIYWDTLDEDEKALIEDMPQDEEELLINQIMLFTVRERRLMKAINKYKDAKGGVYVYGVTKNEGKRNFKDEEEKRAYEETIKLKVAAGERLPGEPYVIETTTSSTIDLVARLEKELTSVQSQKTRAVDALAALRFKKQQIEGESKGNALVHAWAESVMKARKEHGNG